MVDCTNSRFSRSVPFFYHWRARVRSLTRHVTGYDTLRRRTGGKNRRSRSCGRRRSSPSPSPRSQQSQSARLTIPLLLSPLTGPGRPTRRKRPRFPNDQQHPLFEPQFPHDRCRSAIQHYPTRRIRLPRLEQAPANPSVLLFVQFLRCIFDDGWSTGAAEEWQLVDIGSHVFEVEFGTVLHPRCGGSRSWITLAQI